MLATARVEYRDPTGDGDTGSSLHRAFGVRDLPALTHEIGDQVIRSTHLLEGDHIWLGGGDPVVQTLSGGGSEAIDVDSGNSQHPTMLARPGFFWVRVGR